MVGEKLQLQKQASKKEKVSLAADCRMEFLHESSHLAVRLALFLPCDSAGRGYN